MLTNACQLMSVRIAQIGNIKVGAVRASCAWLAFIRPSCKKARSMEPSDKVRVICTECEHSPVSRRCAMPVKRRTNTEAEPLTWIIFIPPHCPAFSPGRQTRVAQNVKNSVIKVHGALKVVCTYSDISQHLRPPVFNSRFNSLLRPFTDPAVYKTFF